jgi:hypothetical protein
MKRSLGVANCLHEPKGTSGRDVRAHQLQAVATKNPFLDPRLPLERA